MSRDSNGSGGSSILVAERIDDWRRRLIDLSFRNRLINYKPTKSSTLEIQSPSIHELLADPEREQPFDFYFPPEDEEEESREGTDGEPDGGDPEAASGEIVTDVAEPDRLRKILENLARRSNAEFDDKALRVLHLAVGFLDWKEPNRRERIRSPLILVPVELKRASPRDPYRLFLATDEEIVINPALTVKLETDVQLEIPEDWIWEGKPLAEELEEIRRAVADTDWTVEESAVLGIFSFQKMVMFRDLLRNEERVSGHPLIQALATGDPGGFRDGFDGIPSGDELDSAQDPMDTFSILDADSSQRRCIQAAKDGHSFVMQGPPGTGKSQTIANVIAEALGQGKRVLFISEKIAALDVVHKRLSQKGLGDFCLKLHGRDAARKEVVASLHESLTGRTQPRPAMSDEEFGELRDARDRLNKTVALLHGSTPVLLGRSPRQVYAEMATLEGAPTVAEAIPASTRMGEEARRELVELIEDFESLIDHWDVVTAPEFAWQGFQGTEFDTAQRSRVQTILQDVRSTGADMLALGAGTADRLELDHPAGPADVRRVVSLCELLSGSSGVEPSWLRPDAAPVLREQVLEARAAFDELAGRRVAFSSTYPYRTPADFPEVIDARLQGALDGLARAIGRSGEWEDRLYARLPGLCDFLERSTEAIDAVEGPARELFDRTGQPWDRVTVREVERVCRLADICFRASDRPDGRWLVPAGLDAATRAVERFGPLLAEYEAALATVRASYSDEVLDFDVEAMLRVVDTAQGKFLGKLGGSYRSDVKRLRSARKDGAVPADPEADLKAVLEVQTLGARIDDARTEMESAFGRWFQGRETDAEAIGRAMAVAREAGPEMSPATNLSVLEGRLCVGSAPDTAMAQKVALVRDAAARLGERMSILESLAARAELTSLEDQPIDSLRTLLAASRQPALELRGLLRTLAEGRASSQVTISGFESDARLIEALRGAESTIAERADHWRASLGTDFNDGESDWDSILVRLDWLEDLFENLDGDLNAAMEAGLSDPSHSWPDFEALRAATKLYEEAVGDLASLFVPDHATEIRGTDGDRAAQDNIELCARLADRLDDLPAWTDYRRVRGRIGAHGWERFADLLVEDEVPAAQVVPAFRKAYWSSRLDLFFGGQPELREFRGRSQERLIGRFRELDRRLIEAGTDRIIERLNRSRPQPVSVPGSEVAILGREAKKKRRHMPVRHLLQRLPSLLPSLKPCLMMSPLTVSHYLSPDHAFDLVVFDEASQVPPWDAINCIYRGAQLIVVGDSRQLPPTPFFQQAEAAEEGWEDDEESKEELMESILDACEVMLPSESLRWHYRSRHEHLISFSNHHFYGNRLVTFPSSEVESRELGVHLHHVPDGVYDRARSNTNRLEARRVAERVMENLREHPDWTLGVVAFSVSQADAIADELDRLRTENPELDRHFAGDRLDGVFVKNLESVQGDERDVIVFSVGYARDPSGRFHQGFGPLNKDGGHRRLNVAVTRARRRVDVVTSVLAADFNLSATASPGAQRLRDYLEFAERGPMALTAEIESQGGNFDSPFEESVAEAVRDLGYEVVPQVGVGGFRIDLGVVDPAAPGRFVLGIECDGATYHSTPTARDRDRLRQEILEGLGWTFHRIWSWDWVRERGTEVTRLDDSIKAAIEAAEAAAGPDESRDVVEDVHRPVEAVSVVEVGDAASLESLDWVTPYEEADMSGLESGHEFHAPENRYMLRRGLSRIFDAESPICEDRVVRLLAASQGITRRGSRVRATTKALIDKMVAAKELERRGEFLWLPDQELESVRVPDPAVPGARRDIEEIPPEEIDLAIRRLTDGSGSADAVALVSQTARLFGFARTGPDIEEAIHRRVETFASGAEDVPPSASGSTEPSLPGDPRA